MPDARGKWSGAAFIVLIVSFAAAILLAILDGVLKSYYIAHLREAQNAALFSTWTVDLRFIAEQTMIAAAIVLVGAKVIEARSAFGFDNADPADLFIAGPDDGNTVWISRRYGSRREADAAAAALSQRVSAAQATNA